jgi:hypothetical protein
MRQDFDDEDDDCGVAFPHMDDYSRYDDEPDDMYADFSIIFGGAPGGSGKGSPDHHQGAVATGAADSEDEDGFGEGEGYEDYMDDLDGIPWLAR